MKKPLLILGIAIFGLLGAAKVYGLIFLQFSVKQSFYAAAFLSVSFSMFRALRPPTTANQRVTGLPTDLLRTGWKPYRFPDSDVVVILPQAMTVAFGDDGVLHGSSTDDEPDFTATLHADPRLREDREFALEFVSHLASTKGGRVVDTATYRYFSDPKTERDGLKEHAFWVIGIPGAVVVVSLTRESGSALPNLLEEVRAAIPRIVGELV